MNLKPQLAPVFMGVGMGLMALGMLHGYLTGAGQAAGLAFVAAHVAVVLAAALLAALGLSRASPLAGRVLSHRPSPARLGIMLFAASATAGTIHLIHGGPTWI